MKPSNIIEEAITMNNPGAQYVMNAYGVTAPATPENVAQAAKQYKLPFLVDLDEYCISPYCNTISTLNAKELVSYVGKRDQYLSNFGGKLRQRIADKREAKATTSLQEVKQLHDDSTQYTALPKQSKAKTIVGGLFSGLLAGGQAAMQNVQQSRNQPQTIVVESSTSPQATEPSSDKNKTMIYAGAALGAVVLILAIVFITKKK